MANCPVCNEKIGGIINIVHIAPDVRIIRAKESGLEFPDGICLSCLEKLEKQHKDGFEKSMFDLLSAIRVTTYPPSNDEKYEYCGIVTATAAIGTGPITQIASAFTDFIGVESETYNEKLRQAEKSCMAKIKRQAIICEANAIAGASIAYTELTSGHGMVLVCMTGTAMRLADGPQDVFEKYTTLQKNMRNNT